jgi:hypothetical protein
MIAVADMTVLTSHDDRTKTGTVTMKRTDGIETVRILDPGRRRRGSTLTSVVRGVIQSPCPAHARLQEG